MLSANYNERSSGNFEHHANNFKAKFQSLGYGNIFKNSAIALCLSIFKNEFSSCFYSVLIVEWHVDKSSPAVKINNRMSKM